MVGPIGISFKYYVDVPSTYFHSHFIKFALSRDLRCVPVCVKMESLFDDVENYAHPEEQQNDKAKLAILEDRVDHLESEKESLRVKLKEKDAEIIDWHRALKAQERKYESEQGDQVEEKTMELKHELEKEEQKCRDLDCEKTDLKSELMELHQIVKEARDTAKSTGQHTGILKPGTALNSPQFLRQICEQRESLLKSNSELTRSIHHLQSQQDASQQSGSPQSRTFQLSPKAVEFLHSLHAQFAFHRADHYNMEDLLAERDAEIARLQESRHDMMERICLLISLKGDRPSTWLKADETAYQLFKNEDNLQAFDHELPRKKRGHHRPKKHHGSGKDTNATVIADPATNISAPSPGQPTVPIIVSGPDSVQSASSPAQRGPQGEFPGPEPAPPAVSQGQPSASNMNSGPDPELSLPSPALPAESGSQEGPATMEDDSSPTRLAHHQPAHWTIWILPLLTFIMAILLIFYAVVQISRANVEMRQWLGANDTTRVATVNLVDKLSWATSIGRLYGRDYTLLAYYPSQEFYRTEY